MAGKKQIQSHATGEKQTVTDEQWNQMQSLPYLRGKHFIVKDDITPPEARKAEPVKAEPVKTDK